MVILLKKYTKDATVIANYKKFSKFDIPDRFMNGPDATPKSGGSGSNKNTQQTPKSGSNRVGT